MCESESEQAVEEMNVGRVTAEVREMRSLYCISSSLDQLSRRGGVMEGEVEMYRRMHELDRLIM